MRGGNVGEGKFTLVEGINDVNFRMIMLIRCQDWGALKLAISGRMKIIGHVEVLDRQLLVTPKELLNGVDCKTVP